MLLPKGLGEESFQLPIQLVRVGEQLMRAHRVQPCKEEIAQLHRQTMQLDRKMGQLNRVQLMDRQKHKVAKSAGEPHLRQVAW